MDETYCILDVGRDIWDDRKEMTYTEFISEAL
jgi:hypothetical protein